MFDRTKKALNLLHNLIVASDLAHTAKLDELRAELDEVKEKCARDISEIRDGYDAYRKHMNELMRELFNLNDLVLQACGIKTVSSFGNNIRVDLQEEGYVYVGSVDGKEYWQKKK